MPQLIPAQWQQMLLPDVPVLEVFVRVTVVYLALCFLLRFVMKREEESGRTSVIEKESVRKGSRPRGKRDRPGAE